MSRMSTLRDIRAIRKLAAERLVQGAVTVGYGADRQTVAELLNDAFKQKLVRLARAQGVESCADGRCRSLIWGKAMLRYAVIFFIIAIIAAVFGFGGIATGAAEIAKILFFIFLVIFLATLLLGLIRR